MDEGSLDGNALAALLEEVFGRDVTSMARRCADCGGSWEVGRHRLYRSAGYVLRCPGCGSVAARFSTSPDRTVFALRGSWTFR